MKKASIFIALIVIISSCSTTSFLKRKYTKGLFIESIVCNNDEPQKINPALISSKRDKSKTYNIVTSAYEKENLVNINTIQNEGNNNLSASASKNSFHKKQKSQRKTSDLSTSHQIQYQSSKFSDHLNRSIFHFFSERNTIQKKQYPSDDDKIIQVLLALFPILCLIAIYLHDGKNITTNFWIDIILHFFFILPAVIFALLVVLDIINLK